MKSVAEQYALFSKKLRIENISGETKERAGDLILATIGVGIAGSDSFPGL